jgi:hypothetical protein
MNMMTALTLILLEIRELGPINRFQNSYDRVRKYFTLTIEARNRHLPAHTTVFTRHRNDVGSDAHILAI